ncbi:MAG TPA: hypothetical protein VFW45_01025 [Candidatus Polarisedimenticolia bacterium]|nr:hypothetical protein [Candidatus Polarisedimenticolia bacterium]
MASRMLPSSHRPAPSAGGAGSSERGSALLISVLVMVILTLLGISYLMLAQTESQIAENELNAQQALFVAEAGARTVMNWFNDPTGTGYKVPTVAQMNRGIRWYDHDGNPGTAVVQGVAGNPTTPIYRDGTDDPFEKAYRGNNFLAFMGEESHSGGDEGPDLRIDAAAGGAQAAFLADMNNTMFSNYPSPNKRARITRIDVYAPPLINIGGQMVRFGIATVKVTAGVFINPGTAAERQVAQRMTKVTVAEVPYPGDFGPLTSCNYLSTSGDLAVHWGLINAAGNFRFNTSSMNNKMDSGFPYDDSGAAGFPNAYITGAKLTAFLNANDTSLEDPWFGSRAGQEIQDNSGTPLGTAAMQPWPYSCPTPASGSCTDDDHSNLFQNLGFSTIPCPDLDYGFWRQVAISGIKNAYYYKYAGGGNFNLNGSGAAVDIPTATTGKTGLFFFDTANGLPPTDSDGDGVFENLTAAVTLSSGWNSGGFIFMNAGTLTSSGLGNSPPTRTMYAPGEPWIESNGIDGWQSGETVLDLTYPTGDPTANPKPTFTRAGTSTTARLARGPNVTGAVHMAGVIYNSGYWNAKGNGAFFGSIITKQGIIEAGGGPAGTPDIWFDTCLKDKCWPPPSLKLPRVVATSWESDM